MEFRQAFSIATIDKDIEGKSTPWRGMRQLAKAIEKKGFRVVAGLSLDDTERLAQIFNTDRSVRRHRQDHSGRSGTDRFAQRKRNRLRRLNVTRSGGRP